MQIQIKRPEKTTPVERGDVKNEDIKAVFLPYFTMMGQIESVSNWAFEDIDEALKYAKEMFESLYPYEPEEIESLELEYSVMRIHVKFS